MHKLLNFFLALSCFLPLYFIFLGKNVLEVVSIKRDEKVLTQESEALSLNCNLYYNILLIVIWCLLCGLSIIGIIYFKKRFLERNRLAKQTIIITKANNITADYYFTYFSLFVLSFFTINPTKVEHCFDMFILGIIISLMFIVYIKNDMYYINPII